jgi:tetratricopeptide (TPR) repeat protein
MKRSILVFVLLLALGCATYTAKMQQSRDLYYDGRYEEALGKLHSLADEASDRDRYLFLLERGKVNLAIGEYDSAIVDLQAAERRFLEIEGTSSVGDWIKSALVNPGMGEFQPEPHEKILINTYLMLAYWLKGDREGAFVERNRTVVRLGQYLDGLAGENREKLEVPFARYLVALLYEAQGRADDARIEYQTTEGLAPEAVPEEINPHLTEIALFAEVGRAPVKVSTEIRGWLKKENGDLIGFFTLPDGSPFMYRTGVSAGFSLDNPGVVFTFAYPRCVRQERIVGHCTMVIDGVEAGRAIRLDTIEETALASFQQRLGMILIEAALRTALKVGAQTKLKEKGGAVSDVLGKVFSLVDRADTRSWQTLPAEVHLFRMEVEPGFHEVYVKYYDAADRFIGESVRDTVRVDKGGKGIVYMPGPA